MVYKDDWVALFQGDARRLPLTDESVGIVITSPPYNAHFGYDGYDDWLTWGEYWHGLILPSMREALRVLVPGGRLCVNLANVIRTPDGFDWPILIDQFFLAAMAEMGGLPRERITWVKGEGGEDVTTTSTAWGSWRSASNPVLRATSEPIYIIDKQTHSRCTGKSDITAAEFKAWSRNTWFVPVRGTVPGSDANPAQMPPEIPRRLMKLYGYVDDVALDPFAGEGTTLRAAKDLGRHAIGVEQGLEQCERAANRCRQDLLELYTDESEDETLADVLVVHPDPTTQVALL